MVSLFTASLLVALVAQTHCARILFFYGGGTYSHKNAIWSLVSALADRGHNVTFFSPFPKQPWPNTKVNDVVPEALQRAMSDIIHTDFLRQRQEGEENEIWFEFPDWVTGNCRLIAANSKTDPKINGVLYSEYDLIVINGAFSECGTMWAHHHGTKFITSMSTSIFSWAFDVYGLPMEASWLPDLGLKYNFPMSFFERARNYLWKLYTYHQRRTRTHAPVEQLMMETFNMTLRPDLLALERQASLVFVNTYSGVEFGRPLPPYFIQVGGMQCWTPRSPLSHDLQGYLDGAQNGAVLIAFGTNVDFGDAHSDFREVFFEAIRSFPKVRFLWKWNGHEPANKPDNILFAKWLPQMEILAHPNTRAFVSHCGLNSILEATYEGVPVLAMPLFGDQDYNAYHVNAHKLGVLIEAKGLTANTLKQAIAEILGNKQYSENMARASKIFRDRPLNPIEAGVFWTEFVLRNDGNTRIMKPLSYAQYWWQRHLVDVFAVLLVGVIGVLLLTALCVKKIIHVLCVQKTRKHTEKVD